MKQTVYLVLWTIVVPILAWLGYFGISLDLGNIYTVLLATLLIGSVFAAVHHAEVVAHYVKQPFGSLLLALAITVIEVALIVSLMLTNEKGEAMTLARDTVLAAVMIILTGIIGICLFVGGARYKEQVFRIQGASAALITLTAILVFTLILPNYTTSRSNSEYSPLQLMVVGAVCLILYGSFILLQATRHRGFFLPQNEDANEKEIERPTLKTTIISSVLLLLCLTIVVLLAKSLAPNIESVVKKAGAPKSLVGVIIAAIVLLPEGLAAYRAAKKNRLQTSLNLALGSALASIGLTIPTVAVVSVITNMPITLGIDMKATILLGLSQFTIMLALATGRTNILQGIVLLMIFIVYLFTIVAP